MNTPIVNPVELPQSKIIIDFEVISNHLVFNKIDPFNRTYLDMPLLREHNNKENTKQLLDQFNQRFDTWKKSNKL